MDITNLVHAFDNWQRILLIIPVALGVIILLFSVVSARRAAASTSWVDTMGTITVSHLEERSMTSQNANDPLADADGNVTHTAMFPKFNYAYTANGQTYNGSTVALLDMPGGWASWIADHPVGMQVPVFYDPHNPSSAALIRPKPGEARSFLVWAVVLFIAGAACSGILWFAIG